MKRWVLYSWVGIGLFFLCGGIYLFRLRQAAARYSHPELQYGSWVRGPESEARAMDRRGRFIKRAEELRKEFEPWAKAHADLLTRMRKAPKDNLTAFEEVYKTIPSKAHEAGMRSLGQNIPPEAHNNFDVTIFSWQAYKPRSQGAKEDAALSNFMRDKYQRYHDFPLAMSYSSGASQVTLWASGRVTEISAFTENKPGMPATKDGEPLEIAPPYSFL